VDTARELVLPKPTIFSQKQKLCCRASSARFELFASTISTRLAHHVQLETKLCAPRLFMIAAVIGKACSNPVSAITA
jgi:hypothetical protein